MATVQRIKELCSVCGADRKVYRETMGVDCSEAHPWARELTCERCNHTGTDVKQIVAGNRTVKVCINPVACRDRQIHKEV